MLSGTCKPLAGLVLAAWVSLAGVARGQAGDGPNLLLDPSKSDAGLAEPDADPGNLVGGSVVRSGGRIVADARPGEFPEGMGEQGRGASGEGRVNAPSGDFMEGMGPGTPAPAPADEPGPPCLGECWPPTRPPCPPDWLQHPLSVGWFLGAVQGSPLIEDWVGMDRGVYGGVRVGFDHDANLGWETRIAMSSVALFDSVVALKAANLAFIFPPPHRNADLFQCDLDLIYYPWGDRRLRPYFTVGLGATNVRFTDAFAQEYRLLAFSMPVGIGVKYLWTERLALRIDCTDDIAIGVGNIDTLHDVSLTAGMELHFGGARQLYWPWSPGRNYW